MQLGPSDATSVLSLRIIAAADPSVSVGGTRRRDRHAALAALAPTLPAARPRRRYGPPLERSITPTRRAPRHVRAVARRLIRCAVGEECRLRSDARAGSVSATHARRHRRGSRNDLTDAASQRGRSGLRLRSAMPVLVLYVNGGIGEPSRTFGTALSVVGISLRRGSRDRSTSSSASPRRLRDRGHRRSRRARGSPASSRAAPALPTISTRRCAAIAATTPADLQRVARRYLGNPTIALVLPRNAAELREAPAQRVALVHDYLNQRGGAERVFAHIARAWPQAPVYTALYESGASAISCRPGACASRTLARIPWGESPLSLSRAALSARPSSASIFRRIDTIVSSTTRGRRA